MVHAYTFFVLCALVGALYAYPGAPDEAYCVDLTSGNMYILPDDKPHVSWVAKPTSNGGRCNLQGVLKINPPSWAHSVSFHMAFEKPEGWSFNIGDSPTNNGWAGDAGSTTEDAEIHSLHATLQMYKSDVGGSGLHKLDAGVVKTAMLIRLSEKQVYATNYEGYNYYTQADKGLFAFDTMYMGLNRVVSGTSRTGRGLCSVCIYFLKHTTASLHAPKKIAFADAVAATKFSVQ